MLDSSFSIVADGAICAGRDAAAGDMILDEDDDDDDAKACW